MNVYNALEERIFYNAALTARNGVPSGLRKSKERCGSWKKVWDSLPRSERGGVMPEAAWQSAKRDGITLILYEEDGYPPLLRETGSAPLGIYIRGTLPTSAYSLAIVGTRKATDEGKEWAKKFAGELSRAGFTVVSGLALGIDAAAHEGCLANDGDTIAVLGNGLDRFYPKQNEYLAERILDCRGALVSEYPPGTPPFPSHFLERNRIVSGLSQGILVIEAPRESGSLVTAHFGAEQGRQVFVLPGPARHPNFIGSHALIREGAELVTTPSEILEAFKLPHDAPLRTVLPEGEEERTILEVLKTLRAPADVDKISELTNLKTHTVSQTLTYLIVKNHVKEVSNGYIVSSS